MVLSPLAVVLLAQLGILLFGIIFYLRLQRNRLIKELEGFKSTGASGQKSLDIEQGDISFDHQQAELLLNRSLQNVSDIASEAPAARALCQQQQELLIALGDCLGMILDDKPAPAAAPARKAAVAAAPAAAAAMASDELVSQPDLDAVLAEADDVEEFDLDDLDGLETDEDAADDDLALPGEEPELPEDTLQATLDSLDDFDFSDLEEELLKDDDKK
ncbi:hypothetical protein [Marinospirillum alkaliphilum]|uniref:Uncharacterized protein n=1 Tax=Marinospirillum alkaliphilum DSM 21637 TaxID=1122209 RepID=A0A1K1TM98_9GAMM|nr:hypothetical protein [Marinospirillum alkaliphilum]SFX01857.1 hypothetical protein SAMN02745752_00234 [Marinospirillum alkaliphilum DSM 21637]